jgi:hypothetical protein
MLFQVESSVLRIGLFTDLLHGIDLPFTIRGVSFWPIFNTELAMCHALQPKAYADNFKWKGPVPEYD